MASQPPNSTPDLSEALLCASVLGEFDEAVLSRLLGVPSHSLLEELMAHGFVSYDGTTYRAQSTHDLSEPSLACQAELHTQASRYYYEQMQSPDLREASEPAYVHHLVQSCELLLRIDPTTLHQQLQHVSIEGLRQAADRQLLRYYIGLGAGLADRLSEARSIFAALLQEPDLDALVRGRALNSGALFAQMQGDYQQSLDAYTTSLAIWKALGLRMREANALHNLGILRYELHDLEAAEQYFLASLAMYRELNDQHHVAMSSNELGLIYRDQGRWQQAQAAIEGAAAIFEQEQAENYLGIALGNLAEVSMAQGHYVQARLLFERSLSLMDSQVYAVDTHINLGLLAQVTDDAPAALAHYQQARQLAEQLGRREIMALIEYREGHVLQQLGELTAAHQHYAQSMLAIEEVREPLRDQSLLISLMGRWQLVYESALLLAVETGADESAFTISERARARAFADQLRQHDAQDSDMADFMSAEEILSALAPESAILSFFCAGLRGLETNLIDALPDQAASLRTCMAAPTALIGILLTKTKIKVFRAALDPNMLQSRAGRTDGTRFLASAVLRRLYDTLITPIAAELEQMKNLHIIPHGPLHHLPFAALLSPEKQPPLKHLYIAYAPSVSVLMQSNQGSGVGGQRSGAIATSHEPQVTQWRDAKSCVPTQINIQHSTFNIQHSECLALGYAGSDGMLPHAEAEAEGVATILAGEHWHGQPGIRAAFLEEAWRYRYLHLACHGEFNLDDPLDSWLELGPNEILSAADMLSSPRLQAELVTLSACRSGISRVLRGDEPMGLARGFLGAGACAVLVTLWQVEDSSARLLMTHFYTELKRGMRVAEALQAAQHFVATLNRAEATKLLGHEPAPEGEYPFAEAYFWAAYTLIEAGMSIADS